MFLNDLSFGNGGNLVTLCWIENPLNCTGQIPRHSFSKVGETCVKSGWSWSKLSTLLKLKIHLGYFLFKLCN